ncbi:MAG: hypothetical protein WB766_22605 [Roseiarcus sp.]
MCAWKVIVFPGARYDYRDCIGRNNQQFPVGPVSTMGAPDRKPPTKTRGLAMPRKLPSRDVVVSGLGWTGSIVPHGLTEAGPARALSLPPHAADPTSLIRVTLEGRPTVSTAGKPTGPGMSSFGRKLADGQVAALLAYVRNSWGLAAPAVAVDEVAAARRSITERAEH